MSSIDLLSAERRSTPLLHSASVSDNSGNSPQMSAPRRSREIDQSTQRFHVGCDNRCGYKSRHPFDPGWYFELQSLDVGEMTLILTNQAVFVTLSVVTIPPLAQGIFILLLNQADVIGDQSDAVTQNAWFHCALCAAISGEISILIQTGAESWGRFPVPRICRWESTIDHARKLKFINFILICTL